jgi:hypothetical protein
MLLPQSGEAFRTLHTRLQCAPTMSLLGPGGLAGDPSKQQQQGSQRRRSDDSGLRQDGVTVDEAGLLQLFVRRQEELHRAGGGG